MSKLTRHEMLTLALGVLPPPPMEVEVLSEDGGAFPFRIFEQEGELLHAFAPRKRVRKELHLLARVTDEQRGRYEVEFEVDEAYFHSGSEALVHAAVSGVRHRKMRRAAPRIPITERTQAHVLFCRTLPRNQSLDVRLSDISTTGIGFTTDHPYHRYLKRTMALEGLFGTTDEIVLDLGRQLLETRQVPRLIEL